MRITTNQLKAARALLDWTQDDLADKADVALATIQKFEIGVHTHLQGATEASILRVLSPYVEFNGSRGVALRDDTYHLIEGPDCYLQLLHEVYETVHRKAGAEVLFIGIDDSLSPPEVVAATARLADARIKMRFLCSQTATRFDRPMREYRVLPARFYTNSVMVVFADRVGILRGVNRSVMVVRDRAQANMQRGLFEFLWLHAVAPKAKP